MTAWIMYADNNDGWLVSSLAGNEDLRWLVRHYWSKEHGLK